MPEEVGEKQTILQKLLFYTTAFFVLLGIFSLFAFLFLVPFVIDPAFTTIFMEFDPVPALCQTLETRDRFGVGNCTSWPSCREGCTKEVATCSRILVNYRQVTPPPGQPTKEPGTEEDDAGAGLMKGVTSAMDRRKSRAAAQRAFVRRSLRTTKMIGEFDFFSTTPANPFFANTTLSLPPNTTLAPESRRLARGLRDYDYDYPKDLDDIHESKTEAPILTGPRGNDSEWQFVGARLYPNVKGCGYPPMLNCSVWSDKHNKTGANFSCYYSRIDPELVITELDMDQVYMNLVLAIAIPIPSFIISVIYMTIAYFKIYNEDETEALVPPEEGGTTELDATTPVPALASGAITPGSEAFREDLASFGHQLKVAMADEMSRESIADAALNNSNSISGNLSKTMTTSISTPPGPIAAV